MVSDESIPSMNASLAYKIEALLGEGPIWDEDDEKLYWVDILSGMIYVYDPDKKINSGYKIDGHVGAIALREHDGLVMVTEKGFSFFNLDTEKITPIEDPESHISGNRFNDGKCDPYGRFWAGTMAYSQEENAGSLYCLNPDLSIDVKLREVSISNGLAWNKNWNKFFYIDTPERNIMSFDYEYKTGAISNRNIITELKNQDGYPDGMAIDEEDHLWVALYGAGKVIRIDPTSGEVGYQIKLPVPKPTCCTFGGGELDELYITTCQDDMSKEELKEAPLSGSLFKAKVPFRGLPTFRFSG